MKCKECDREFESLDNGYKLLRFWETEQLKLGFELN